MNRQHALTFLKGVTLVGIYGGLLMPLVFIPTVIFPFVFSKLLAFQILIGVTFPAYLLLAWLEPRYRPKKHALYLAIVAYFFAIALSCVFAMDPVRAWWGNQERMNGLFTLLHFFAWLTMTTGLMTRWEQWRKLLNYEAVLAVFMAIVALLQLRFPKLLLFPASTRVGGLLDNPIYMGAYQIFNLFFLGLLFLKTSSKNARYWYIGAAVVDIAAFIAAQSRGALLGLGVGILAFAAYYGFFNKEKKVRVAIISALVVLVASYGLLFAFRNTEFVRSSPLARFTNLTASTGTRLIAWRIAWNGFLERPLTGWGFDNFHLLFNHRYNPDSLRFGQYETWFDRSHNTILDVLSMTGIFGFIGFAAVYLTLFYSSWRAYRKGWIDLPVSAILFALPIAYFVQNLFVFDHPAAFSMSYLLFALVIAATRGQFVGLPEEADAHKKHEGKRQFSWPAFAVLEALACLLVWTTSILPFKASALSIKASQAFANRQFTASYDLYQQAFSTWTPYLDEQSFLVSRDLITLSVQGNLTKVQNWKDFFAHAQKLSEEEIRRHPTNTHPRFIYARLLHEGASYLPIELGTIERAYLDAIETSPKRQQLHTGLARFYLQAKRTDDAIRVYKTVLDFDTELGESHWMYGLALFFDGNKKDEGAKEIVASQDVTYRYALRDPRELQPLLQAYLYAHETERIRGVVEHLDQYPLGSPQAYAEAAFLLHTEGGTEFEQAFIDRAESLVPGSRDAYTKRLNGDAVTLGAPEAPAPSQAPATQPESGSGGAGPRR